ncbi:MAG: AAA family ATPase [Vicinamibacterales bacterium]
MPSILELLEALDLEGYASIFADNEVDFESLLVLTDRDLEELRDRQKRALPYGPRKRLLNALSEIRASGVASTTASLRGALAATVGERRRVAVLFCDMVGSTKLSERPLEIVEAVTDHYREICETAVRFYEGLVHDWAGDGMVALFGYPAPEAEVERAIRAALDIIDGLARQPLPGVGPIQVRIGIATGVVMLEPGARRALGAPLNLAARLQQLASVGSVVVCDRSRRNAPGRFDYENLGLHELEGVHAKTQVWRVRGLGPSASRFEAATQDGVTPLVGRREEISLLLERWRAAQSGEGATVVISGVAGIGKSRVLSEVLGAIERHDAGRLQFQCSQYYGNSAFYPFIDQFERILKFDRDSGPAERLAKLESLIADYCGQPRNETIHLIGAMLSIPCEERYGPLRITPQRQKELTIHALKDVIGGIAAHTPQVVVFEDVHWADPTTLHALDVLVRNARSGGLLVVITDRIEDSDAQHTIDEQERRGLVDRFKHGWVADGLAIELPLSGLTKAESSVLVSQITGGRVLNENLVEQIISTAEGKPLWVEALTTSLLDTIDGQGPGAMAGSVTIPDTLQASLQQSLNSVKGVAKRVAQLGAVIGREFSHELIAAVASMSEQDLSDGLSALTKSGLALQRGAGAEAVYVFKHALVRDAAYESLHGKRCADLHCKIAEALEERFPASRETEPELFAHHYTRGGHPDRAVPFWREAGALGMRRYALSEAIAHLRQGLRLVEELPPGRARDREELAIRTQLSPALVAAHG